MVPQSWIRRENWEFETHRPPVLRQVAPSDVSVDYNRLAMTLVRQLNLPVDRPVLVHLSSKDVIHSFGLLEMRVKQDAIPGLQIPVWFIPNRVGEYEITCSQLCGLGHFRMRGFVTIQTDAAYKAWVADQLKQLTPTPEEPVSKPRTARFGVRARFCLDARAFDSSNQVRITRSYSENCCSLALSA
jgi:heme/copper-type cytochrome/quinol oxidase subunit 2